MVVETVLILWLENGTRYVLFPASLYGLAVLSCLPRLLCMIMHIFLSIQRHCYDKGNGMVLWKNFNKEIDFVLVPLTFTLSATYKNKGRRHLMHLQWIIWGGFWSILAFLGTYTHYHCYAMRLCLHHNRYGYLPYLTSSHIFTLWIFVFIWTDWERDWWAKGDILPWCRLVSSWRNKVWGCYCSDSECWWGLYAFMFHFCMFIDVSSLVFVEC